MYNSFVNGNGKKVFAAAFSILFLAAALSSYIAAEKKCAVTSGDTLLRRENLLERDNNWKKIDTAYFEIYVRPDANLKSMEKKLKKRTFFFSAKPTPSYIKDYEEKIAYRTDIIFNKAKQLLGMAPRCKDIKIFVFRDGKELGDEYYYIFGEKRKYQAFYIHKFRTIYTTEADISDSVLAHEMGHVIVDHYFVVRPPEKVREMLSIYVDEHLED
ncbi:MAG: hypothetical protein PHO00_02950 [bacterium]|nr:hypothetical protein [bacterium]